MTNPNNAIGTNGAFSGRTSPNALNDILGAFSKGIVSGWTCSPKTGMTVQLGGSASTRDVALAEDNAGNKLTIDNRSGAPVEVTLGGAPSTNNRIDAIVAYVDNPSTGDDNTTDNPTACGIISVSGTVAANPTAPSDAQIRSAITTDGATGGVAYYVVLATILVGTNVTTIGSGVITAGAEAKVNDAAPIEAEIAALQTRLAQLEPVVLFNGPATDDNIALSQSAANFKRLKIFTINNGDDCDYVEVYEPNGKTFVTTNSYPSGAQQFIKTSRWKINTTSITSQGAAQSVASNTISTTAASNISIYRVEGYTI